MRTVNRRFKRRPSGNLAEFPPVLIALFILIIFPFINLLGVAVGLASIALTTMQCATRAAAQPTYRDALTACAQEATQCRGTGFMRLLNVQPTGGYQNCGIDLFIRATNYVSNNNVVYGPNSALPPPVKSNEFVYEYTAHSMYQVHPWINMSGVPFVNQVPGLGQPVPLSFDVHRAPENLAGLIVGPDGNGSGVQVGFDAPPLIANNTDASVLEPPPIGDDWNHPDLYQLIADAGETIVATAVVVVQANNPNWTPTNLTVAPGQKVWIDTRADGQWTQQPGLPATDADGVQGAQFIADKYAVLPGVPNGALIGSLGGGSPFFLGVSQLNYPPSGSGTFSMMMNGYQTDSPSGYASYTGAQTVRVIVVQ